jgi:hypothetical protein
MPRLRPAAPRCRGAAARNVASSAAACTDVGFSLTCTTSFTLTDRIHPYEPPSHVPDRSPHRVTRTPALSTPARRDSRYASGNRSGCHGTPRHDRMDAFLPALKPRSSPQEFADRHRVSIPCCVLRRTRHWAESGCPSGTLRGMRVAAMTGSHGVAGQAVPSPSVRTARGDLSQPSVRRWGPLRRSAGGRRVGLRKCSAALCSTGRGVGRTVCTMRTPSRWNMPEALVAVTDSQSCCAVRESHSVMAVRREAMCPPVRVV